MKNLIFAGSEGNWKHNKSLKQITGWILFLLFALFVFLMAGCKKDSTSNNTSSTSYQNVALVSDTAGYGASIIDSNLSNAWGIAIGPTGYFWVASNHKDASTIYDRNGNTVLAAVTVDEEPTGVIYNSTSDFNAAKFIFAGEGGTILTWSSGTATTKVIDNSVLNAVYKGIAMATDAGNNFIYLANFKGNKIDVYDKNFNIVLTKLFLDPSIPAGFAPFNIQNIGNKLYVTYAKQKGPDNEDDQAGVGNGYINIFNPDGTLVKRFTSQGTLDSPWGLAVATSGFGTTSGDILVGNFGDGRINVFDSNGNYKYQLADANNSPISIEGLWGITFPVNGVPAGDPDQLFYAAGPADEGHGVFGYIKKK